MTIFVLGVPSAFLLLINPINVYFLRVAALNVGRILAHRMKGLGLNCARFWDPHHTQYISTKVYLDTRCMFIGTLKQINYNEH